jgi:hypothetical protein
VQNAKLLPHYFHHIQASYHGNSIDLLDQTLVDSHLETIPSLGSLTTRSLSGGDLQSLGWQTDRALDAQILGLCAVDELLADLLEGLNVAGGEGDADLVGFLHCAY